MRSVIYICEHNKEGAMGLVINKPMEQFTVETVLEKLKSAQRHEIPLFGWIKRYWPVAHWLKIVGLSCIRHRKVLAPVFLFHQIP